MNRAHQLAWRSLTRTCVVCLLGGVVINVAVAWGCALGLDLSSATMAIGTDGPDGLADTWVVRVWTRTGSVRVSSHRFVGVHSSDTTATELVPAWTGFGVPLPEYESRTEPYESRFAEAWGWPLVSMWYQTDKAFTAQSTFRAGVRVAGRVLPLRPIWVGFAGNSAVFALAVLLLSCPFTARRFSRLWQDRCVKCGYPIGVSLRCTECGCDLAFQRGDETGHTHPEDDWSRRPLS